MTLEMFRITARHRPSVYARAAGVCLIVSFGVFLALGAFAKHFPLLSVARREVMQPKTVAARAELPVATQTRVTSGTSVLGMQQKLDADTSQLIEIQKQRKFLLASSKQDTRPAEAHPFSSEHATRQELVSDLVLLLHLEKADKSESSEIIAVRHKITRLQHELNQGDVQNPAAPVDDAHNRNIQLGRLRAKAANLEADISTEQSELARLIQANLPSAKHDIQPAPPLMIGPARNDVQRPRANLLPWIVVASLLLGVASAASWLFYMARRSNAFCNANSMAALAGSATLLGAIPRMNLR